MLYLHRAERADGLVGELAEVVRAPLADPLDAEIVAVPTRGVERWLAQRLAAVLGASPGRADGVCANVEFPFPGRLVGGAVAAALGVDPQRDPWLPERAVWPLLEVVEEALDEPWLAPLAGHLRGPDGRPPEGARRFTAVRHVADLFDRYAVHRPALVRAWLDGGDDGERWQAELWRRLRGRIGVPGPAERFAQGCARLRAEPALLELPARVSLFGLTRLPPSYLDVLSALAAGRDVHLFLLHPSAELWSRVAAKLAGAPPVARRQDDPTARLPQNPLLASLGRDAREMQLVLAGAEAVAGEHVTARAAAGTLLGRLQHDVRADRRPPGPPLPGATDERPELDPDDRSLQVHACHGRARQVEVVRDAVLHLLAGDPTLEPRDAVVMCPDIESFAPLVQATFGGGRAGLDDDEEPPAGDVDLRVRLADRSLRQTNPVLAVVAELLELVDGRFGASQVLDLAGRAPVRRRFRLDDDDLARVAGWAAESGVRFGLDAEGRAPYKLDGLADNTWRAGWDRVLAGVAMAEEEQRLVGGVLPLDAVGSGDIDLAGRFAELLDRLGAAARALAGPHTVAGWASAIAEAADALTDVGEAGAWQRAQLGRLLDELVDEAAGATVGLSLPEARALLADRLRGRPTRASFRTGHLTMCTLVPMRSVPHRVVCLMGLDDGVFPRHAAGDGDDLVERDPHVGDREPRSEDRQLLLDALLAATEHFVITYTGRDERTNLLRPPAVPLGELLDVVDRTVRPPGAEGRASEQVVVQHPLQPFDQRNFDPGALVPDVPWSFDEGSLQGARALAGAREPAPPFLARPLPPAPLAAVELDALERFLRHPVRAFLRQRLEVSLADPERDVEDALPIELDALAEWAIGQRLVEARLAGAAMDACVAAERARGSLPPGRLADALLARLRAAVEQLVAGAQELLPAAEPGAPVAREIRVPLVGRPLVGTVSGLRGGAVASVTYSRLGPAQRLRAWVRLLALAAARPELAGEAVTVGRLRRGGDEDLGVARIRLPADAAERRGFALEQLTSLLDLYERGLREPLPLFSRTSAAYAQAAHAGRDGLAAAERAWASGRYPGEDRDPEHVLVLGGVVPLATLLAEPPREDERGPGWPDDPCRFGRLARRLWDGLLAHEELGDR